MSAEVQEDHRPAASSIVSFSTYDREKSISQSSLFSTVALQPLSSIPFSDPRSLAAQGPANSTTQNPCPPVL